MKMGFDESFKYNYHQHIDVAEDWRIEEAKHFGLAMYKAGAASRQSEINKLNFQLATMKSRLNDAYTDGQSNMYKFKKGKIDELQNRIDKLKSKAEWYIEDCACSHPMSKYQLGWFEAMSLVLEILKGEQNE